MDYAKCSTATTDSRIVLRENRSKFELINSEKLQVEKIKVDGCLISDARPRCDWVLVSNEKNKALYVELKGCEIDRAIEQLKSTLTYTRERYSNYNKKCFVVSTRVPKHGSSMRRRCLDFYNKTKVTLCVKNVQSIEEL